MMRMMNFKRSIRRVAWVSGAALVLVSSSAGQAQDLTFVANMLPAAVWLTTASTSSLCITITYDKNGNRVSQTVANMTTATTVWGSGTYGCFVWKP